MVAPLRSGPSGPAFVGTNQDDAVLWDAAAGGWYVGPVPGGVGGVTSFNTRVGVVVPATNDYDSDEIANVSTVTGASVSDALDNLNAAGGFTAPAAAANLGAAPVLDFAANRYIRGILDQDATPTIVLPASYEVFLELQQPAAGGPFVVVAWPGNIDWTNNTPPTLSTAADAIDIIRFLSDGARLRGWAQAMNIT
jgi:hypothetical protein